VGKGKAWKGWILGEENRLQEGLYLLLGRLCGRLHKLQGGFFDFPRRFDCEHHRLLGGICVPSWCRGVVCGLPLRIEESWQGKDFLPGEGKGGRRGKVKET